MQCHTQSGRITFNIKVGIDFTLLQTSVTKILTWKFHVHDSAKGRYDMILDRYLLTALGLTIKYLIMPLKQMMDLLKGLQHPWLIWVHMHLKI